MNVHTARAAHSHYHLALNPVAQPLQTMRPVVYTAAPVYAVDTRQIGYQRPVAPLPQQAVRFAAADINYPIPSQLVRGKASYRDKLAADGQKFLQADREQAKAYGQFFKGSARAVAYAPLGVVEMVGRSAVAISGGHAEYGNQAPSDQIGRGLVEAGHGASSWAVSTDKKIQALASSMVHAPMAGLEATAEGVGMVAGSVVRAGSWAGQQVKESFLGQAFGSGYQAAMPSHN